MLNRYGEERRAINLFPEIKASVVPRDRNKIEVNFDLRPDSAYGIRDVAFGIEIIRLGGAKRQELLSERCRRIYVRM